MLESFILNIWETEEAVEAGSATGGGGPPAYMAG